MFSKTYARQKDSKKDNFGRKPLGSYNSAPSLPTAKALDTVLAENKPIQQKAMQKSNPTYKRNRNIKKENIVDSSSASNSSKSDFSSPIFGAETKDDVFDKLFTSPVKTTYVPKNRPSWDSSKEYFSAESSVEKGNTTNGGGLLFTSLENSYKAIQASGGKKISIAKAAMPAKKAPTLAAKSHNSRQPKASSDRLFSDATLDYVAEDLEACLKISGNESDRSDDIFSSPPTKTDNICNVDASKVTPRAEPPICNFSPIFGKKASSATTIDNFSPILSQKATSTPTLVGATEGCLKKPHVRIETALNVPSCSFRGVHELIVRKGGKNWRRSVKCTPDRRETLGEFSNLGGAKRSSGFVLSRIAMMANARRQTFHPHLAFDEGDEENDTSCKSVSFTRSVHSSSYIVTCDNNEIVKPPSRTEAITTDIEKVLARCTNRAVIPFESMYGADRLSKATKIGEGSFGEVFLLPDRTNLDPPVVKIVPFDGTVVVNGHAQTKLSDILAEIIISTELSELASEVGDKDAMAPGFLSVRRCDVAQGCYPEILLEKWDEYDRDNVSENDRPDGCLFASQSEPQKFVVLELSNGGKDLEHIVLNNAAQGLAVFDQVAHAMAMAEKALLFEHRDLHWGNILVRESDEKTIPFKHKDECYEVETMGVKATIIDFSLSRVTLPGHSCVIFNNLAEDEELFQSEGDYQFDIYRQMRQHTKDDWRGFFPKTNVFWLHYLLDKLTGEVRYKNKKSKAHRSAMSKMRAMKESFVEDHSSCYDYVKNLAN